MGHEISLRSSSSYHSIIYIFLNNGHTKENCLIVSEASILITEK